MTEKKYIGLEEYIILLTRVIPLFVNQEHTSYISNSKEYKACYVWFTSDMNKIDTSIYSQFNTVRNLLKDYIDVTCTIHDDKKQQQTVVSINYDPRI